MGRLESRRGAGGDVRAGDKMNFLKAGLAFAALLLPGAVSAQQDRDAAFRAIGQELRHVRSETFPQTPKSGAPAGVAVPEPAAGPGGPTLTIGGTVSASVGYFSAKPAGDLSRARRLP